MLWSRFRIQKKSNAHLNWLCWLTLVSRISLPAHEATARALQYIEQEIEGKPLLQFGGKLRVSSFFSGSLSKNEKQTGCR